jgi:Phosphotransferase system, HPr-related proteins
MTERYIKLSAKEDVKEFVSRASKCDFDIDISYNRIIVDAKSILGVLSLDLSRKLTVQYRESDTEFETFLNNYAII